MLWDEWRWIFGLFGPKTTPAKNKTLIISPFNWLNFNASYLCAYFTCMLVEQKRKWLAVLTHEIKRWVSLAPKKKRKSWRIPIIHASFLKSKVIFGEPDVGNRSIYRQTMDYHITKNSLTAHKKQTTPQPGRQQSIQNKNSLGCHLRHPLCP